MLVTLTIAVISSATLSNVLAKEKVVRGKIECVGAGINPNSPALTIICCQTETGVSSGIEIRYCTRCDNTNPPSNCTPRWMDEAPVDNPTGTKEGVDIGQPLTPSKSNEESSQKSGMNLEQALTTSKSN